MFKALKEWNEKRRTRRLLASLDRLTSNAILVAEKRVAQHGRFPGTGSVTQKPPFGAPYEQSAAYLGVLAVRENDALRRDIGKARRSALNAGFSEGDSLEAVIDRLVYERDNAQYRRYLDSAPDVHSLKVANVTLFAVGPEGCGKTRLLEYIERLNIINRVDKGVVYTHKPVDPPFDGRDAEAKRAAAFRDYVNSLPTEVAGSLGQHIDVDTFVAGYRAGHASK